MLPTEPEAAKSTFVHLNGHHRFKPEVASSDRHWRRHLLPFLSLFFAQTRTHTHAHAPSHLPSPCLFPLVSPDRRAPQTVFTSPQALRHSYRAAGLQPFPLFMNQVQLKYIWAKDRWPAHRATKRKRRGWVLSCGCTHKHPPPLLAVWSMSSCPEGPF